MELYKLSEIGEFHTNHNEDALAISEIGENKIILAVMDGCSMGKESHFASTLIAKLLRKIGKELSYRAFVERNQKTTSGYLKEILQLLFKELQQIKNQLFLETEEVLTTLILGVLDKSEKAIELITIGDGLICANGILYEYEQDDKPDYLGYHLSEDFELWFQAQTQKLSLENITDLSIVTDGIFTFKSFDGKEYSKFSEVSILDFLLLNKKEGNRENILRKKLVEIENKYGLIPGDDLTIVRVIFD